MEGKIFFSKTNAYKPIIAKTDISKSTILIIKFKPTFVELKKMMALIRTNSIKIKYIFNKFNFIGQDQSSQKWIKRKAGYALILTLPWAAVI